MTETLTQSAASAAIGPMGWRVLVRAFAASVPVPSLAAALRVADAATDACGADADGHLRVDLRPERVELSLADRGAGGFTARDVELAEAVTLAVREQGFDVAAATGAPRPVQTLEIAIDALDIAKIVPFWGAVLGYRHNGDEVVDPAGQGPTIWFQQLDEPRPQRNRIHFDIVVAHDEADTRIAAALAAGGHLVSDEAARSFWILADAEGNEVCVCTWQGRD